MKKIIRTKNVTRWQCESCNRMHARKDYIFHCPEHGEYCRSEDDYCSLSREVQDKEDKTRTHLCYCCPICGWVTLDYYGDRGKIRTEKERASLRQIQKWILSNPRKCSEYPSFKRLKAEALKNRRWMQEIQKGDLAKWKHDGIFVCQKCEHGIPTTSSEKDKKMGLPKCELGRDNWLLQSLIQDYDDPSVCSEFKLKIDFDETIEEIYKYLK